MRVQLLFLLFIIIIFFSCSEKHLQISDLEFPENIFAISKAKYKIDTAYLIHSYKFNGKMVYDTTFETFDEAGNLVKSGGARGINPMSCEYEYDSLNLLRVMQVHSDYLSEAKCNYIFNEKDLTLLQCWSGRHEDTSIFIFNRQGKLLNSLDHGNNYLQEWPWKSEYYYNDMGQLLHVISTHTIDSLHLYSYEKDLNFKIPVQELAHYYYTGASLDSIIKTGFSREGKLIETNTSYFKNGLMMRMVRSDSMWVEVRYGRRGV